MTPLCAAASHGSVAVLRALLKAGADVNKEKMFYETPFMCAVLNGHAEAAVLLMESKADITKEGQDGEHALTMCASKGLVSVLRALFDQAGDELDVDKATWVGRCAAPPPVSLASPLALYLPLTPALHPPP